MKDRDIIISVILIIKGNIRDRKCISGEIPFINFNYLTDGTLMLGSLDIYYSARLE